MTDYYAIQKYNAITHNPQQAQYTVTLRRLLRCPFFMALAILISYAWFTYDVMALEWQPRNRDQFSTVHSHFVYPIILELPGVGSSSGIGATVLNANDSDVDFTGFALRGDFDVTGGTMLNYHLLKNRLLFDIGIYNFVAAVTQYRRGIESKRDDFIIPRLEGNFAESQLTWSFNQRRIEAFVHLAAGRERITQIIDSQDQIFPFNNDDARNERTTTLGLRLDNTDDLVHPHTGYRLDLGLKLPQNVDPLSSDYVITDYNGTFYVPLRQHDVLSFNFFRSDAHVTSEVKADYASLQQAKGLNCTSGDDACLQAESDYINQLILQNRYGTATSLGGLQRLRSFPYARYYAGHSMSYGFEYRINFNNVKNPFNYYIAKGVKTGLQLALFGEQGSVAERSNELFDNIKTSYGIGFRLLLTDLVIRGDYATGSEGDEFTLFFDYPWKLDYTGAS